MLTQYLGGRKPLFLIFSPKTRPYGSTFERVFLDVVSIMIAPENCVGENSTAPVRLSGCIREDDNAFCNLPSTQHCQELFFGATLLIWFPTSLLWNLTLRWFKALYTSGYYYFLPRKDINIFNVPASLQIQYSPWFIHIWQIQKVLLYKLIELDISYS